MPPLPLDALYAGQIFALPPSRGSRAWVAAARGAVAEALGVNIHDLPTLHRHHAPADLYAALELARLAILCLPLGLLVDQVSDLGLDPGDLLVDLPRLRLIPPGGARLPAAAPAYFAHRDTWYANPRSQINLWWPLFDLGPGDGFRFFPAAFGAPVANDSDDFDWSTWQSGGWQAPAKLRPYPRLLGELPEGPTLDVTGPEATTWIFSAAHLHQTLARPHTQPHSRLSIDLRLIPRAARAAGQGAPDPDNRSRGDTSETYQPLIGAR